MYIAKGSKPWNKYVHKKESNKITKNSIKIESKFSHNVLDKPIAKKGTIPYYFKKKPKQHIHDIQKSKGNIPFYYYIGVHRKQVRSAEKHVCLNSENKDIQFFR